MVDTNSKYDQLCGGCGRRVNSKMSVEKVVKQPQNPLITAPLSTISSASEVGHRNSNVCATAATMTPSRFAVAVPRIRASNGIARVSFHRLSRQRSRVPAQQWGEG